MTRYITAQKLAAIVTEQGYEDVHDMLTDLYTNTPDATYDSVGSIVGVSGGTVRNQVILCGIPRKTKNHTGRSNDKKKIPRANKPKPAPTPVTHPRPIFKPNPKLRPIVTIIRHECGGHAGKGPRATEAVLDVDPYNLEVGL